MSGKSRVLFYKLYFTYLWVMAASVGLMVLSNTYIGRYGAEVLTFNIKALLCYAVVWFLFYAAVTYVRLSPVRAWLDRSGSETPGSDETPIWHRLTGFPMELFWMTILFGSVAAPSYYIAESYYAGRVGWVLSETETLRWVKGFLFNTTSFMLIAMVFYSIVRWQLRPYTAEIVKLETAKMKFSTFIRPLLITFSILLLIISVRLVWVVFFSVRPGGVVGMQVLYVLSVIALAIALAVLLVLAGGFRRELIGVIRRIEGLLQGGQHPLQGRMSIFSRDEVGQLGMVFNELQSRIAKEYREIEKEKELVRSVQAKLLPAPVIDFPTLRIVVTHRPAADSVSGGFYDAVELPSGRIAILAGGADGTGMPAALLMSAVMALFRTHSRGDSSPGETLSHLNASLFSALQGMMEIHCCVAVADPASHRLDVAAAGAIAVQGQSGALTAVRQYPALGAVEGTAYEDTVLLLEPDESVVIAAATDTESMAAVQITFTGFAGG